MPNCLSPPQLPDLPNVWFVLQILSKGLCMYLPVFETALATLLPQECWGYRCEPQAQLYLQ